MVRCLIPNKPTVGTDLSRAKEFADASSPKKQIAILYRMLQELGIEGKPTLAKAKSVKEARELAAELSE
jgi:glutamate/tyrosine decarboxylase-like PLP-dependent enzyme